MKPANNLREIVSGLWFWSSLHEEWKVDFSCCAWNSKEGLVLIDPIELDDASLARLEQVGKPVNDARADLTLAHVHALLGQGQLALGYAQRCLAFFENNTGEDWDMAFAHAEMAFAAAVLGDADLHAKHYAQAKKLGEAIQEEEDRTVFMDEFSRIPSQVLSKFRSS